MKLRKKQREATHYLHNRSLTTNQQEQKQDGPVVAEENNIEGRGVIYWRARALAAESKLDKLRKEVEKHGGVLKGRAESASRCDEKDAGMEEQYTMGNSLLVLRARYPLSSADHRKSDFGLFGYHSFLSDPLPTLFSGYSCAHLMNLLFASCQL